MEIRQTPGPEVTGAISTGMPSWMVPPGIIPRADILDTGEQIVYLVDLAGVDPDISLCWRFRPPKLRSTRR